MVRDELAGFLGDMNRYNNGSGDRPFWLEAYGGGSFSVERLSRGPVSVERLTIGVIGGIQPDRLSALLMKARDDDGMLARFCPVFPLPAEVGVPTHVPDNAMVEAAFTRLYGLEMVDRRLRGTACPSSCASMTPPGRRCGITTSGSARRRASAPG